MSPDSVHCLKRRNARHLEVRWRAFIEPSELLARLICLEPIAAHPATEPMPRRLKQPQGKHSFDSCLYTCCRNREPIASKLLACRNHGHTTYEQG